MATASPADASRVPAWAFPALLIVPLLLIWLNLGGGVEKLPVERRSRAIVRTMAQTGDWLVPRVDGKPFLSKPPLYHWIGAAASRLRGEADWWAVRFPSALAAVAVLGLTLAWGWVLGGPALGVAAALSTGSMSLFLIMARRGATDMVFSALCVAALFLFERIWRGRRKGLLPAFALAVGLAMLAKGTPVLLVVLAPVALALTLRRGWREALRREVLLWLAAAAALGASWYVAIFIQMPREALFWAALEGFQPVAVEAVGHTGRHFRPFWYYFYRIWDIALPASAFLPLTVWHVWRAGRWRGVGEWPFVVWSFVLLWALFTLLPAKQPHYFLPLLPLLGLMMGDALLACLAEAGESPAGKFLALSLGALVVLLAGVWAAGLYYAVVFAEVKTALAWAGLLAGAGGLALTAWWWRRRQSLWACLGAVVVVGCLGVVYFGSFEEWKSLDRREDRAPAAAPAPGRGAAPAPPGRSPEGTRRP
ncbi:MAG: glycosyltransferase family 39 protein [Nitrospinota bacterium]